MMKKSSKRKRVNDSADSTALGNTPTASTPYQAETETLSEGEWMDLSGCEESNPDSSPFKPSCECRTKCFLSPILIKIFRRKTKSSPSFYITRTNSYFVSQSFCLISPNFLSLSRPNSSIFPLWVNFYCQKLRTRHNVLIFWPGAKIYHLIFIIFVSLNNPEVQIYPILVAIVVFLWCEACGYTGRYTDAFYRKQRLDRVLDSLHFRFYRVGFYYSFLA